MANDDNSIFGLTDEELAAMAEPDEGAGDGDKDAGAGDDGGKEGGDGKEASDDKGSDDAKEGASDGDGNGPGKGDDDKGQGGDGAAAEGLDGKKGAADAAKDGDGGDAKIAGDAAADKSADQAKSGDAATDHPAPGAAQQQIKIAPNEKELTELKTAFEAAKGKFEEGEIDHEEYMDARLKYERAQTVADTAKLFNEQTSKALWENAQTAFLDAHKEYSGNDLLFDTLASAVNRLAATVEGKKLSDAKLLETAHANVQKALGLLSGKPDNGAANADAQKAKDAVAALKKGQGDASKVSKTLSGVPAAGAHESGDNFAWLDKLEGDAYQKAIDKLNPEELAAYENAH